MTIGFIFDLDGVITDTARFHYQAWKALADSLGIPINEIFSETLKGISRMNSLDRILAHSHRENALTPAEKEALAQQENDHYVQLLEHLTTEDVLSGAVPLLQQAQACHILCAMASASKNAPLILGRLGMRAYFATTIDPDSLSKDKLDPEIFLAAADSIGVLPQNVIGFENVQSGIDGLKAASIYAISLSASQPLPGADIQVSEMTELSVDIMLNRQRETRTFSGRHLFSVEPLKTVTDFVTKNNRIQPKLTAISCCHF